MDLATSAITSMFDNIYKRFLKQIKAKQSTLSLMISLIDPDLGD